jgi:hypothetical protein
MGGRPYPCLHRLALALLLAALPLGAAARQAQAPSTPADRGEEPVVATDPGFLELQGGLLAGIPPFPAYPGARLVGSAERNRPDEKNRGYRIKWTTSDSPIRVMAWYETALARDGWKFVPTDQPDVDELDAEIANAAFTGYLEAETEDGITEIVVVLARR